MRWTDEGINSILELRCMLKNDTWDNHWYPDAIAALCLVTKSLHTHHEEILFLKHTFHGII